MLDTLITSKTRIKLLLRFFLNSNSSSYLRNLETEFGESTNAIRLELNRFEKAGLLVSSKEKNRKIYTANTGHPLFPEINNILKKYIGFDQIVEKVVRKLGGIYKAYITGDLAKGQDTMVIDLCIIGNEIDSEYLQRLIRKTEVLINRTIRFSILSESEENVFLRNFPEALIIWDSNGKGKAR